MMKPNYNIALNQLEKDNTYVNARYAPTGDSTVGIPFPAFREFGGRFTLWQPSSLAMSTLKKQMNLPTDNTTFRQGFSQNAIAAGNESLKNWTVSTQTLSNPSFDTMFCTTNDDCEAFGKNYSCNSNYEPWPDSYGNQSGSVCSYTAYPEIDEGKYFRKNAMQGGIGKACTTNNDCGSGYECNNVTDFVGKNVQQTGYCSQVYDCGDGKKRYMGYPYNSGIPMPPPDSQNNGGQGYNSKGECKNEALAQQNCVNVGSKWFAVYPGYCPVPATQRVGGAQGALATTDRQQAMTGFQIPAYATNQSSSMGGTNKKSVAFSAFNRNASGAENVSMNQPFMYEMAMNPRPSNM